LQEYLDLSGNQITNMLLPDNKLLTLKVMHARTDECLIFARNADVEACFEQNLFVSDSCLSTGG
jgi:hypothetical protein